MRDWVRQLESRSPAWFVSVSLLTVVAVVFCGSGLGSSPPVVGQTEPLRLTLSAPQICETTPSVKGVGGRIDAHGRSEIYTIGWRVPGEVEVAWAVSGGSGPYSLTIDGNTRDGLGAFEGAEGTGWVSCALTHGEAFFLEPGGYVVTDVADAPRYFHGEPEVDSRLKTIAATVTDATGATAEASVDIYVILELGSGGDRLEAGNTYRVFGGLLTVPDEIDLEILGGIDGDGGETLYLLGIVGASAHIVLTENTPHREVFRQVPSAAASGTAGAEVDLHAKLDELVASAGQPPTASTSQR